MSPEGETWNQMSLSTCVLLPSIPVLFMWLILANLLEFSRSSTLFTSMALVLASVLLALSKRKPFPVAEPVANEVLISDHQGTLLKKEEACAQVNMFQVEGCTVRSSLDSSSESECINNSSTSEDSEVEWPFKDDIVHSPDCSDGSITDEESLIEISIPSGHYVSHKEEGPQLCLKQKLTDFAADTVFHLNGIADLLDEINEINEEDNLIEIDISMGSIKCSRFGIEA